MVGFFKWLNVVSAAKIPWNAVVNDAVAVPNSVPNRPSNEMTNVQSVVLCCAICGAREIVRTCLTVVFSSCGARRRATAPRLPITPPHKPEYTNWFGGGQGQRKPVHRVRWKPLCAASSHRIYLTGY